MSKIVMTVSADSPEELFSTIRGAALLISDSVPAAEPDKPANPTPAAPVSAPTAAVIPAQSIPAASVTPTTAPSFSVPAAVTAPPPIQPPVAPPPAYTLEQICRAGADLAAANPGMMPALMALMQRYGVEKVTDLKPEQLGPFATELRGLGAKI